jgi:hypothetical protein
MSRGVPAIPVPDGDHSVVVMDAQALEDAEQVATSVWGGEPSEGDRREAPLRSPGSPVDDQGGYRETLRKRLAVSYGSGAELALVHARVDTSKPLLMRPGFESCGEGRLYTLAV